ncbi:hypothetical protein CFP56_000746 [Quercus suber]|uniref:Uncharacterized protein n=1 Tax=Quercus suber TaxID=58331 RepID=A0AAW0INU5_QUESU
MAWRTSQPRTHWVANQARQVLQNLASPLVRVEARQASRVLNTSSTDSTLLNSPPNPIPCTSSPISRRRMRIGSTPSNGP